jgi:Ran GTPase-activating protein (RanGAP) involved in mRNA processing and transport
LEDIRFSSTRAGKIGSDIVASALDASLGEGLNPKLVKLDLCDNSFANKASHGALYRALGSTTSLIYLNLRDCDLGDDGVQKICHALFESDSALEHLDLSGNCVEKRGAKHIADYIRDCGGKLKILHLEDNEMTSKGVESIAAAFHGSEDGHSIEEIQLNTCMVGAIGARALIDAFGPDGKDLPNLKKMFLNGNSFAEDVLGELVVAFDDRLGEMDDNDSDGDADDNLSDDDEEDDGEDEDGTVAAVADSVDDLAAAMDKSLLV